MPNIRYMDYVNGVDDVAHDGTTWAKAKKTRAGFTAGTLSAGDTVRIAKSGAPTSIGEAKWTQYPLGGTRSFTATTATPIVVTIASHGYSTGDIVAIYSHTQYQANGYWVITKASDNTFSLDGSIGSGGAAGSGGSLYLANASCVKLTTAVNTTIDLCNLKWTPGTNCSTTQYNGVKNGGSFYVSTTASVTGAQKIAYKALPSTLNLSGYQQITFWLYSGTALTAGLLTIKLCSDAAGDTALDTLNIPKQAAGTWFPVTIDKGSALSNGINSISVNCTASWASQTYGPLFGSSITACTAPASADSLTCRSLIGKSSGNGGKWYPIGTINNNIVSLTANNNHTMLTPLAYNGTNSTATSYKREPIILDYATSYAAGYDLNSGTAGNVITWKGGINTADDTQDGETWIDLLHGGLQYGVYINASNIKIERLCAVRFLDGLAVAPSASSSGLQVSDSEYIGCGTAGIIFGDNGSNGAIISSCNAHNNGGGLVTSGTTTYKVTFDNDLDVGMNNGYAISLINGNGYTFKNIDASGSYSATVNSVYIIGVIGTVFVDGNFTAKYIWGVTGSAPIYFSLAYLRITGTLDATGSCFSTSGTALVYFSTTRAVINNITATGIKETWQANAYGTYSLYVQNSDIYSLGGNLAGCITAAIYLNGGSVMHVRNTTFHAGGVVQAKNGWNDTYIYSMDHNGSVGTHKVYVESGEINSETTIRHTASGISWKVSPTSTTNVTSILPIRLNLGKVVCGSSDVITISVYLRRDNAGLSMQLSALGGYITGLATDLTANITAAAGDWQQVSLAPFTAGEDGAVPIEVRVWGGTSYNGYVDDLSVT